MNLTNIKLVWSREVRDQLRDRRMLFTIAVLPLLLYPLIGMAFLQITQFLHEHPARVKVIGSEFLPASPALLEDGQFGAGYSGNAQADAFELTLAEPAAVATESSARREIAEGQFDAIVVFPTEFDRQVQALRDRFRLDAPRAETGSGSAVDVPRPQIFYSAADDRSRIAADRVERILRNWRHEMLRESLQSNDIPTEALELFAIGDEDVSEQGHRQTALWAKFLPFLVFIWALTGAFYPAVDLCAGEKERGTLETLLSSPAARLDIVCGKLLTVMTFSMLTSLLNLASMGLTAAVIVRQIENAASLGIDLGRPPVASLVWLALALVPVSALFSALALAVAAFARSSKEGQTYLMPLLLVTLPLMMLSLLPAIELDFGMSVIPVTGMMLWLRALIEAEYAKALRFALPVLGVTGVCCWLSVRWAVSQFNSESVLFRESERVGPGIWLRHLVRDRGDTPSIAEGLLCGVLLLLLTFFAGLQFSAPERWRDFVVTALQTQILLIGVPALIMAFLLTRDPRKTLLLVRPPRFSIPAAVALAVALHPIMTGLGSVIEWMYPMSDEMARVLQPIMQGLRDAPIGYVILLVGVTPAICEELAFRGFVLSGLKHLGSKWSAIGITSVFFGLTHGMLQQSMAAIVIGLVIGYVAVQTGSLWPGVAFHFTHNSLSVLTGRIDAERIDATPVLSWLFHATGSDLLSYTYRWPWLVVSLVVGAMLLAWFARRTVRQNAAADEPPADASAAA